MRSQRATAVGLATAIVVGLVAITPAAGFVSPISALALGGIAAVPSYFALLWRARTRLDDSLDVVAAHGLGGMVGALLTGVFAERAWNTTVDGLLFGNAAQLGIQAAAVLAAVIYSGAATFVLLKLIGLVMPLRAASHEEGLGMDVSQHGEEAYAEGQGAILVLPERGVPSARHGHGRRARMKLVVAIVRSDRLECRARGAVQGRGPGAHHQPRAGPRRRARAGRDLPRHHGEDGALGEGALEIGVSNHFVEPTVNAIMRGARTGDVGDGKIFVLPVEKVYRIRTGEEDQAAVTPVHMMAGAKGELTRGREPMHLFLHRGAIGGAHRCDGGRTHRAPGGDCWREPWAALRLLGDGAVPGAPQRRDGRRRGCTRSGRAAGPRRGTRGHRIS
jgi:nitrogen regulatory protein PII